MADFFALAVMLFGLTQSYKNKKDILGSRGRFFSSTRARHFGYPKGPPGSVRLTKREVADHKQPRLSCSELTPFSECRSTVLFEDITAVEVAV